MNLLLFFLLVAAGEAAYFETMIQQQTADAFQQQEAAWQSEDDSLRGENKQILETKAGLEKDIATTQVEVNDLISKLQGPKAAPPEAGQTMPTAVIPPLVPPTVSLGTVTARDNQKFENCHLLKVEADGITFSHSEGITKVLSANLPDDLQKRFDIESATGQIPESMQTRYNTFIQQQAAAGASGNQGH